MTHTVIQSDDMTSAPTYYEFRQPLPELPDGVCETDPVGVIEIAERLGVLDRSVHKMIQRGRLPEPDHDSVNGSRAWNWRTVLWWAGETRRLNDEPLRDEYRRTFRMEPPVPRKRSRNVPGTTVRPDPMPDKPSIPTR